MSTFDRDYVYLAELGDVLSQHNIKFEKKLSKVIGDDFGWTVHRVEGSEKICYVKIKEVH